MNIDFSFRYKPFKRSISADTITLVRPNIEVKMIKSKFNPSDAVLVFDQDSLKISTINGYQPIGVEEIPTCFISGITYLLGGQEFQLPDEFFQDLYEPDWYRSMAYFYDDEIILVMNNSLGHLGYKVVLF